MMERGFEMAILPTTEFARLRNTTEATRGPIDYTKAPLNAAFQAIEDYNVGSRTARPATSVDAAIELATPGVFAARQKDSLIKAWEAFSGNA